MTKMITVRIFFFVLIVELSLATRICNLRLKRQNRVAIGSNFVAPRVGAPGSIGFPVTLPAGWKVGSGPAPLASGQVPIPMSMTFSQNGEVVSSGQVPITGGRDVPFATQAGRPRKLADNTTVYDCFEWRSGKHEHGTSWKAPGWHFQCNNGTVKILGCLKNDGTEIALGKNVTIDGFWVACTNLGSTIRFSAEPSCIINGKALHIGENFKTGTFKMSCQEFGYNIEGCYITDAEGNERELALNDTFDEGIIRHSCTKEPGENGRVRYQTKSNGCQYNGTVHKPGEKWIANNKEFQCGEGGGVTVNACITDDNTRIVLGTSVVTNGNRIHSCYRLGRVVYYYAKVCGDALGVPCVPDKIPTETRSINNPEFSGARKVGQVANSGIQGISTHVVTGAC